MADYHDIYLKCNVLLLTDLFEKFRATCLANYSLDDVQYYTVPGLHGWAMSQPLPTHGFRFLQPDEIEALAVEVGELSDDAEDGYIFEVDLSYPQDPHDAHDDYPLAPESLGIGREIYSPAQQAAFPQTAPQRKLTPNLRDEVRYVVHYRNLKLYLQLGLAVTRIQRVLTVKQSTWLRTQWKFNGI